MRTRHTLLALQALPLARKIGITAARVAEFYERTKGKCYVSFSGGKDSTVLLRLVRGLYPDIPAVFCDTGLEYPEVKDFVSQQENITVIRPEISFKKVIEQYGFPVVNKDVAKTVEEARAGMKYSTWKLNGELPDKNGKKSRFNMPYHKHFLTAPFKISSKCCDVLKKRPFHRYEKETGRQPIIGTMAEDSLNRQIAWVKNGCNSFDGKRVSSAPMSFWLEQDVLAYIKAAGLKVPAVYGDVRQGAAGLEFQGVQRTGCIFCLFGLKYDGPRDRFHRLAESHPGLYRYCMETLGLAPVLEYLRQHNGRG